jgi:hypothetical protein
VSEIEKVWKIGWHHDKVKKKNHQTMRNYQHERDIYTYLLQEMLKQKKS